MTLTTPDLASWVDAPVNDRSVHILERGDWSPLSYVELAAHTRRIAGGLAEHSVGPGDRVLLAMPGGVPFIAAFFATWLRGATPTPLAPPAALLGGNDYTDLVMQAATALEPVAIVVDAADIERLSTDRLRRVVSASDLASAPAAADNAPAPDLAIVQLTSGATGMPKTVRVPMDSLRANVAAIRDWLGWGEGDQGATWLPMHHDMGLIGMIATVTGMSDGRLMQPEDFIRRPLDWLRCFGEHGATMGASPPFGLEHVVRRVKPDRLDGLDFSAWRGLVVGAERVAAPVLARFAALLEPFGFSATTLCPAYGMAETTLACTASHVDALPRVRDSSGTVRELTAADKDATADVVVSCGPPVLGMRVRVVDDDGHEVPDGTVGRISAEGSSVAAGYGPPGDGGAVDFDGVLDTGDMGFAVDGELFVLGRAGDAIRLHGQSVFAEQVEFAVGLIDGLPPRRYCVVLGQDVGPPAAVVVLERPVADETIASIVATVRRMTGGAADVRIVDGRSHGIPRTTSGKPRRRELWRAYVDGRLTGADAPGGGTGPHT